jgi:hypothetical protein
MVGHSSAHESDASGIGWDPAQHHAGIDKPQLTLLTLTREDLIERAAGEQGYFFKNLLFRDTILITLPEHLKRTMHDKAAQVLQQKSLPGALEERLFHSGHGVDDRQAIDALLQLGDQYLDEETAGLLLPISKSPTFRLLMALSQKPLEEMPYCV